MVLSENNYQIATTDNTVKLVLGNRQVKGHATVINYEVSYTFRV